MKNYKNFDKKVEKKLPYKLVVKNPFLSHVHGEFIEDEDDIKDILSSTYHFNVVKVNTQSE